MFHTHPPTPYPGARAVDGISNPTIGLLNIGEEVIKGNNDSKNKSKPTKPNLISTLFS